MRARNSSLTMLLAVVVLASAALISCAPANTPETKTAAPAAPPQEIGGQEEFGPYEVVANWPQPLPDGPDGVKHEGWTWGSSGAVYAETPDRIWIAMRGELPLPPGAKPWTPYGMLNPTRGNATGNDDGSNATCDPEPKRGWQRRYHHVLFVVDRDGKQVDYWPEYDKLFDMKCGRGPHKIKMNPYDPDKHVWIIDDQLHMIYKFTYDMKQIVLTLGTKGQKGRDGGKLFDRPTDIDWLPDGTFFISDGYGGTRVAKFDKDGKFLMDWGTKPKDTANPGPNEFNTVHSIAISKDRRLFVVDRGHRRFQVFDENGKFLDDVCDRREFIAVLPLHFDRWVPLGGRRRDEPNPQVRPGRTLFVRLGRTGRPARAIQWPAPADDRPGWQPVRGRSIQRPNREIPAKAQRRPGESGRPGGAL